MPLTISDDAILLIVTEEDSGEAYYNRHYTHFDWPEGASGPTIGIGYDCGYVTAQEVRDDWAGIIPDDVIAKILPAVGRTGANAQAWVAAHRRDVAIAWDPALAEFKQREVPKWIERVVDELPNCNLLSGDCLGSLVSLAYNRGASFNLPGVRFAEMRAIKAHMAAQRFDLIPDEFLAMRRLWPRGGDLWNRRMHEAALFERGLGKPAVPVVAAAAAPPPAPPSALNPAPSPAPDLEHVDIPHDPQSGGGA